MPCINETRCIGRHSGAVPIGVLVLFVICVSHARATTDSAAFETADAQLNARWRELSAVWSAEAFAELRENQRLWLKSRDAYVADGDDRGRLGPGSAEFEHIRTERTRERVRLLDALLRDARSAQGSGLYGDGLGRSLRVSVVDGSPALFELALQPPAIDPARHARMPLLSGAAHPIAGRMRAWSAESDALSAAPAMTLPQEILFELAEDPARVRVTSSGADEFTGTLYLLGALRPATAPMRELLRRLPAEAYDQTEEGLEDDARRELVLQGETDVYTLQQAREDRIRLRYGAGEVDVLRFAQADGTAWIAVATRNVRVRTLALWELREGERRARRRPEHAWLPTLGSENFFAPDSPDQPPDGGWVPTPDPDGISLWIDWPAHTGELRPTHRVQLIWRDGRFDAQSRPLSENDP